MVKVALTYIIKDDSQKEQFEKSLKSFTPYFDKVYVAISAKKLNKIDKIVELAKGRPTFVDGDKDWEIIWELFVLWHEAFPENFEEFSRYIAEYRRNLKNKDGMFKSESGELYQAQLEIPEKLFIMIKTIYPDQKWDRKFVSSLARRLPILKIADKI